MNADGSEQVNLTSFFICSNYFKCGFCAWSQDGKKIVFSNIVEPEDYFHSLPYIKIYVVNSDGSGLTNLTNNPALDLSPNWSP